MITAHLTHIVPLLLFLFSSLSSYTFFLSSSSSSHPLLPPRIAAVRIPRRHHYRCRRCEKGLHRPGIEPGPPAVCSCSQWQASILPLNHRCTWYECEPVESTFYHCGSCALYISLPFHTCQLFFFHYRHPKKKEKHFR